MRTGPTFLTPAPPAAFVDYDTPEGQAALGDASRAERSIVANPRVLGTGVDVPEVELVVLADPVRSFVTAQQMIGRAARRAYGVPRVAGGDARGAQDPGGAAACFRSKFVIHTVGVLGLDSERISQESLISEDSYEF